MSKDQNEEENGKNSTYVATKAILGNKVRFLQRTREMDPHHSQWRLTLGAYNLLIIEKTLRYKSFPKPAPTSDSTSWF